MPRVYPPRRTPTSIRLDPEAVAKSDERAAAEGVKPSVIRRRLFDYALRHMPEGWKP